MRATRPAEQALRLATSRPTKQYVCRACRAQAARQFTTSSSRFADEPFYRRLQKTLFGSKESKEAEQSREEKQKRRIEELAERDDGAELETKTDKHGRQYEIAAIIDPTVNKDYVQSTTWSGLESVGSEEWVKKRADQGEPYIGFAPRKRMELSNERWVMLLQHITVEALVLQKAQRDVEAVCWPRGSSVTSWAHTRRATIQPSVDGGVTVSFAQPEAEQEILQAIPLELPQDRTQSEEAISQHLQPAVAGSQESKQKGSMAPAWMDVSLQDSALKMAILKRALQLTGKRLPDPAISSAATVADLYHAFRTKEKPKKLAQTPQLQRLSLDAPNVSVHSKRQTPIDKERAVGRWKVIEEELVRRDLPVTGSRYQGARVGVH
ncbi:hypothetical protein LTR85_003086 [Meristemomyces frigidus]|nr:hypothetical protein LTR85_003086 [Meristemomyces frigidus]